MTPATLAHWPAVLQIFEKAPCWCQVYRAPTGRYGRVSKAELLSRALADRQAAMRQQLAQPTPPGLLAYVEGQVAGWCGLGPRQSFGRLMRSRTIPLVDDQPVWSIVCFLVRTGFRRRGVARALLHGAIDTARAHGAPALEAYPVDPAGRRISTSFAYVGTLSMFERAGFRVVSPTTAHAAGLPRWLVRLEL